MTLTLQYLARSSNPVFVRETQYSELLKNNKSRAKAVGKSSTYWIAQFKDKLWNAVCPTTPL